jgi:hypothetical protein
MSKIWKYYEGILKDLEIKIIQNENKIIQLKNKRKRMKYAKI